MQELHGKSPPASADDDKSFGEPMRVFRAKLITRVAVAASGAIILVFGISLLIAGLDITLAMYPLLLGLGALALGYLMGKSMYLVCPGGIIKVRWGASQQCRWEDVNEIVDLQTKQGLVTSRLCALVKKNGSRMELPDLGIDDFGVLVDLLRRQAESRGIKWRLFSQACG